MSEVWINDADLNDYGFVLGADPTHADGISLSDVTAQMVGDLGSEWLGEPPQATTRKLTIAGHLLASSPTAMRAAVDAIKGLSYAGAGRLRFADRATQEFRQARCVEFSARSRTAILSNLACDLSIGFECADPLRYDVSAQGVTLSTVKAYLPIGTMPSFPMTIVHGNGASVTNITLTLRNSSGDAVQSMTLTGTLASDEYLAVDHANCRITKYDSGVASNAIAFWSAGDFLVIRAVDGSSELAAYPSLELSATSGTPAGLCTYARAWS